MSKMFILVRIASIFMLLGALGKHPYSYYQLLRLIVCGTAAWGWYSAAKQNSERWVIVFATLAIEYWAIIDVIAAVVLFSSLFLYKKTRLLDEGGR